MTVQRFALRSIGRTEQRLRGRATLPGGAAMDLAHAGMALQIDDASGAELYGVELPPSVFVPRARGAGARAAMRPGSDARLRRLAVDVRGEDAVVRFTIVGDALIPPRSDLVTLKVKGGDGCGRTKALRCTSGRTGVMCSSPQPSSRREGGAGDGVVDGFEMNDDDPLAETRESRP
jgi:hypothetical protein